MLDAVANEYFVARDVGDFSHGANHDSSVTRRQQIYWIQWVRMILSTKKCPDV
jgi:hypothetical protein